MPDVRIGVEDFRFGNVAIVYAAQAIPRPAFAASLTAAANLAKPETFQRSIELLKPVVVARNRIVLSPTTNHTSQPTPGFTQRSVTTASKVLLQRRQRTAHAFCHCDPNQFETLAPTSLSARMRKTQKVKRL